MSETRKNLLMDALTTTGSGNSRGKYEAMLDTEDKAELAQFIAWWKTQTESSATVSSYKSYLAKAWALDQEFKDLTSDQRSAVRKYAEFVAWRNETLADDIDEIGDEDEDELEDYDTEG